jgi:putative aldouronate transport system permease protein
MTRKNDFLKKLRKQWFLLLCTVPFIVYLLIFSYYPITSWRLALYDYLPGAKVQEFVGLEKLYKLFADKDFWHAIKNTVCISLLMLVVSTICSVAFAVFLNELSRGKFKKGVQTISYLPHFVSWAVVAGIYTSLLKQDGQINDLLVNLGVISDTQRILFLQKPELYYILVTLFFVWKEMGWSAIIYIAAIAGIPTELYEAAKVDGAGRLQRIRYITLTGLIPTILVVTIMNIGWLLGAGYEQGLLLGNSTIISHSEVLGTYVYNRSLGNATNPDYALSIAAGAFQSVVSIILLLTVNFTSKKIDGTALL